MKKSVLDRPLERKQNKDVSHAAFSYLISEVIQQAQKKCPRVADMESRLADLGRHVGVRLLELHSMRSRGQKRETSLVAHLSWVVTHLWKSLWGRSADALERVVDNPREYLLVDTGVNVAPYISLPKDLSSFSAASFCAGIVQGAMDGAGFTTETVQAHNVQRDDGSQKTVIVVRFTDATIKRDQMLQGQ